MSLNVDSGKEQHFSKTGDFNVKIAIAIDTTREGQICCFVNDLQPATHSSVVNSEM